MSQCFMPKFSNQGNRDVYYGDNYDSLVRFISYYYQISYIRRLKPNNILEVGAGNKTVSNYLRHHGYFVDTCDNSKELSPDYQADIKNLPFKNDSYDAILACEILEHLPIEDFEIALEQLYRVTKRYVIISLPYSSFYFELIFKTPFIFRFWKKPFVKKNDKTPLLHLLFRMPLFFASYRFSDNHYWEMGERGISRSRIKRALKKKFDIISQESPILNSYHHFFLLKKK